MTDDRTLIGRPFKGVEVSVRDEEIFINTPYHIEGITLPFSLKDRGALDAQGRLHFLGRTDDVCSVNGRKVSAQKICAALKNISGIEESAVLSRHIGDEDMLTAFIVSEKEFSKPEIIKLLRAELEDYELPKKFIFLAELPRNESGKTDKHALEKLLQ